MRRDSEFISLAAHPTRESRRLHRRWHRNLDGSSRSTDKFARHPEFASRACPSSRQEVVKTLLTDNFLRESEA